MIKVGKYWNSFKKLKTSKTKLVLHFCCVYFCVLMFLAQEVPPPGLAALGRALILQDGLRAVLLKGAGCREALGRFPGSSQWAPARSWELLGGFRMFLRGSWEVLRVLL